jgi:multimeric flavodoxin WrbA
MEKEKQMKIVCLLASPRAKGNSTAIAERFLDKAEGHGAEVRTFSLNTLTYRGCQGCMVCKTKLDRCVLKDDLAEALDAVRTTDILVIATPVYWCDVNAQLKTFIDRTYSYLVPDYLTNPEPSRLSPGKKLVFILAQGGDEDLYTDIYPRYQIIFKWLGFMDTTFIRACSVRDMDDVKSRDDIMTSAEQAAERICAGH